MGERSKHEMSSNHTESLSYKLQKNSDLLEDIGMTGTHYLKEHSKIDLFLFYVYGILSTCDCAPWVCSVLTGQMLLHPLELELQMI